MKKVAAQPRARAIEVIAMFEGTVLDVSYLDGARSSWLTRALLGSAAVILLSCIKRRGTP